jgi:flagellar biosynthesis component FlhA
LNAGQMNELGEQLRSAMLTLTEQEWVPMVITEPDLRVVVRDLVLPAVKGGVVLSLNELPAGVTIKPSRPVESTT